MQGRSHDGGLGAPISIAPHKEGVQGRSPAGGLGVSPIIPLFSNRWAESALGSALWGDPALGGLSFDNSFELAQVHLDLMLCKGLE